MKFEQLPSSAQAAIAEVAASFQLEPASLLPRGGTRTPEEQAARSQAICALDRATLLGSRRYRLADICAWFGVTRNSIYKHRIKSEAYRPRKVRRTA